MNRWLGLILGALLAGNAAGATLKLRDGTVVRGTIVSLSGGAYQVDSDTLGRIEVKQSDVETVQYGRGTSSTSDAATSAQIRQIQTGLAADGSIMAMISALQDDPKLKEILADPALMRAVGSGDLTTLMASEKFMSLLNHPDIKAITKKASGD